VVSSTIDVLVKLFFIFIIVGVVLGAGVLFGLFVLGGMVDAMGPIPGYEGVSSFALGIWHMVMG
jgi:Mg2+/citrate symporter